MCGPSRARPSIEVGWKKQITRHSTDSRGAASCSMRSFRKTSGRLVPPFHHIHCCTAVTKGAMERVGSHRQTTDSLDSRFALNRR